MMQKSHIEGAVNLTIDLVVGLILQRVEAMNRKSNQILRPTTAAIMLLCVYAASALGQQEEMQISNTVQQLLTQMADSDIAGRDTAEANLIALSPDALDFIDVPDVDATTDYITRVLRVRRGLEKKAVELAVQPSRVTLGGTVTLARAIESIAGQTANRVSLQEDVSPVVRDRELTLNFEDVTFWEAINTIMRIGGLQVNPYGGRQGELLLEMTQESQTPIVAESEASNATPPDSVAGPLLLETRRVRSLVSPHQPSLDYTTVDLVIRWEPRMTPISIAIAGDSLKIVDDREQAIEPKSRRRVRSVVQTGISEIEFPLVMPRVSREVSSLSSIAGSIDAVLPGRRESFRFRQIGQLADAMSQTKSGATVRLVEFRKNEDLFAVTVELSFDAETNSLDSHLGWAFDNEIYLEKDRVRIDYVASETIRQQGQSMAMDYYFEEDPQDCDLVYRTPTAIVSVSFPFELKDVVLP